MWNYINTHTAMNTEANVRKPASRAGWQIRISVLREKNHLNCHQLSQYSKLGNFLFLFLLNLHQTAVSDFDHLVDIARLSLAESREG